MDLIWCDCETTGRSADRHDVVQLACIPIVKGVQQKPFNEFCQPKNWDNIEDEAVAVHGISREKMRTFQTQEALLENLVNYLSQFNTKFIIAGFNVNFDKQFISWLFNKNGRSKDFFSLFDITIHDTFSRAKVVKHLIKSENLKLETLAKYWNIDIKAHDAVSDILATMEVDKKVAELLGEQRAEFHETPDIEVPDFREMAHLHLHSMYDMVESIPHPKEWKKWCESIGSPGYAVVDHCSAIAMSVTNTLNKAEGPRGVPGSGLIVRVDDVLCDLNAWAINNTGYFNLNYLASLGYEETVTIDGVTRSVVQLEDLVANKEGILFGVGSANDQISDILLKEGKNKLNKIVDRLFLELQDQLYIQMSASDVRYTYSNKLGFQPINSSSEIPDSNVAKAVNNVLFNFAKKNNIKMLALSGSCFIDKSDKLLQDIIARNSYASGKCYQESYHAVTTKEIYAVIKSHLGNKLTNEMFNAMIDNSLEIVEKSKAIDISFKYSLPKIDIPKHIRDKTADYDTQTYYLLVEKCKQHGRWNDDPVYVERFKKEIDVIYKNKTLNFIPYFLLYEDLSSYARSKGILQGIARGSAGGCLISYYLKIIHIDPIETDLPFERFLSHARIAAGSFPDVDADFGRRADVIEYIFKKYGNGFAQICTFQRMKTKNAIKDAMWALYGKNRKDPDVEAVCNLIPDSPQGVDEYSFLYGFSNSEGEYTPGIIEQTPQLAAFFKQFSQVEEMVKRLIKLLRGWSRHPSAFIVSTLDLPRECIPTMKMYDKNIDAYINVSQLDAPMVESHGLVKADILGVTTIQMISDAVDLIKQRTGTDLLEEDEKGVAAIYRLPEDPSVYKDFYNKKTDSSFQFNTNLIKMYIRQFAPTKRDDLATITALCRPGALDAPLFDTTAAQYYFDVRSGKRNLEFVHPDLEPIIKETNGVFCVSGDSIVSTDSGDKKIADIKVGNKVLTHEGRYRKVSAFYDNGFKNVVRVRLSQGEEIICTPDHKILTQLGWIEAGKLNNKHIVKSFWTQEEKFEVGDDSDWLVGILLADGNLKGTSYDVACSSEEHAHKVVAVAEKEFDIKGGSVEYRGRCWYANLRQVVGNNVFFNKNYQVNKIKEKCKELGIHGLDCKQKILPANYTLKMLAGFFDGDGCTDNGSIRLANKDLAYSLYKAFDSYRIPVSYFEDGDVYTVCVRDLTKLPLKLKQKTAKVRGIKVPRSYIKDFNRPKRLLEDRLRQHFSKRKEHLPISYDQCFEIIGDKLKDGRHVKWSSVLSVKRQKKKIKVYDITVDEDHSFVVGGNVVHNCFQEQVMKFLVDIAGYTLEESDQIRAAIAKKKQHIIMASFEKIRESTKKRDWTEEQTETICSQILAFARYSFNRSHSRAYGDTGYITMYLKKHYPLEWWTAVLNCTNDRSSATSEEKLRFFMQLVGDLVQSPNLSKPSLNFEIHGDKIYAPLTVLKGVGAKAVAELVDKGPFDSLEDMLSKVSNNKVNAKVFAAIVSGRAADCFIDKNNYEQSRHDLLEKYRSIRKCKEFAPEVLDAAPISAFIQERDLNKCFNKFTLSDERIVNLILSNNPDFTKTTSKAVPLSFRGKIPVLANVQVASKLLKEDHSKKVGVILFFQESKHKQVKSKKTGKAYDLVEILGNDGCNDMVISLWNQEKGLRWSKNTLFLATGTLDEDYRSRTTLKLDELFQLKI